MDISQATAVLIQRTRAAVEARRRSPAATYRLQFHAGFTFRDATAITGYLNRLGISDAYASPYLMARPGSRHGYDISDHNRLNPEIGTEQDYDAWVTELHRQGLHQVLDVVPNHMGIVGNANPWWWDVLENGRSSAYAEFFDIDWEPAKTGLRGRVLLPVLGEPYGKALEAGQIKLGVEAGTFLVHYLDHRFPLDPCTYNVILRYRAEELPARLGEGSDALIEYQSIETAITHLPSADTTEPEPAAERRREKEVIKRRLAALTESMPAVRAFVEENVAAFNGSADMPASFDRLDALLDQQAYRLAWWRVAADEINYRRFFDLNELAALRMERQDVFEAAHELVLRLLAAGKVDGLRIDHPDGLFDPRQYLERLQEYYFLATAQQLAATDPELQTLDWPALSTALREEYRRAAGHGAVHPSAALFVVVEKILGHDEMLREDWPTAGTTGYEYLNEVNGLFVASTNERAFERLYRRWVEAAGSAATSPLEGTFRDLVYRKKFLTMQVALSGDLHVLAQKLDRLSELHRSSRDFTLTTLRHALREIVACFEVYRSYITGPPVHAADRRLIERAAARAGRRNPVLSAALFNYVRNMLLLRYYEDAAAEEQADQLSFVGRFQQLTAPVMAKGLEDTAFYVYNRLVSLNEVGGDPAQFGISVHEFHERMRQRQERTPHGLSATATHDTKRGEDVRARLNVLSEIPQDWRRALSRWGRFHREYRLPFEDTEAPDRNDEYLLYQTLVGAWPLEERPEDHGRFVQRIQEYMQKAVHEAKVHTSWINPNPVYDRAVQEFISRVLDEKTNSRFLADLRAFQRRISHYGVFNSLAQVLLKVAAPGVADVYQGTELWDLSLVDPDNRRPVDFALRARLLEELDTAAGAAGEALPAFVRSLVEQPRDGRIKLYVLTRALRCRREQPVLFTSGAYVPVPVSGERAAHVCAFVRRHEGKTAVAVVPRLLTGLIGPDAAPLGETVWHDTRLVLPADGPRKLRNVLTGEVLAVRDENGETTLPVAEVLANGPVALLVDLD